jgi:hypothetical protein|tara:strand:+ start:1211 stop:3697 length:2487 start_codon:yes stop_codon:yes gene_type:complete
MASTYVNDLRLNEMATGDGSGTWGTTTNTNLELIGEALGYGTEGITTNADTHTTTVADGATDPGRAMYIEYTGTLDSACTITIAPNTVNRMHFIENGTSGSQNIIISQGSGANITIPPGDVKAVYLDGAGSGAAVVDAFASLNVVDLKVQDDLTVTDDLIVNGDIDLEGAIDVNGTANLDVVDIDGAVDMASTLAVTGIVTLTDDLIIGDGKTIGSASDVDAITIASNGQLTLTQTLIGTALDISGDIDVDGTTNLDVVDIDGAVDMASTLQVDGVATFTGRDVHSGGITIANAGQIGSVGDTDAIAIASDGVVTLTQKLVGTELDISGNIDVDGTTNLDAVDIDGAVQADATITVGVDDTGYDVKFFGATSGSHLLWDESADDLKLVGAAGLTVAGDISSTTAGTSNFRAGVNAGDAIQSGGNFNVVVGDEAGTAITTGDNNVGLGYAALTATTTGTGNTGIGYAALDANTTANDNTGVGANSLGVNTTGTRNTSVGSDSLDANTEGNDNTAVGKNSLSANTTAGSGTAVGKGALQTNTTGGDNTAVGRSALELNTTGANCTAVGRDALKANTTASNNTAVGDRCLDVNTTGAENTGVGKGALGSNTTGANNTVMGKNAGTAVTTGATNTLIGSVCHDNLTEGSLNTALGYNLAPSAVDVDSEIVIGSSITGAGTNTVRIGTGGGTATLSLDGSDTSWAAASDLRLKKDVANSTVGLSFLNDLRPVTFKWQHKNEVAQDLPQYDVNSSAPIFGEGKAHHGFIAQEVKAVIDNHSDVLDGNNIWHEDPDGTQQLSQGNLVPMLVKAVQELSAKIEVLESQPRCKCKGE